MMNRASDETTRRLLIPLTRIGERLRWYAVAEGLGRVAAFCVCGGAAQLALDRLLVLGMGPRAVMLLLFVALIVREIFNRVVRPLGVATDPVAVAQLVERNKPEEGGRLVSAVAFAGAAEINPVRNSPALVRALIDDVVRKANEAMTEGLLRRDRYRAFLALGGVALIVVVGAFGYAPDTMAAYVQRNWMLGDAAWPSSATIVAEGFKDGRMRWPLGDELTLTATAVDRVPESLTAELEYSGGDTVTRPMDRRGRDQFISEIGPLSDSVRVRFRIGKFGVDEYTKWYEIEAVPRPFVKRATIEIRPPAYARQSPYVLPQGQVTADIVRGSTVRIEAEFNHPLTDASLRYRSDERDVAEAAIVDASTAVAEFEPAHRGTYYFAVRDASGLEDTRPVTYSLNLLTDPPPKARLTLRETGEMVVPNATLMMSAHCEDNLGLRGVELAYRVERSRSAESESEAADEIEPMPGVVAGQLRYDIERAWPLLPLTVKPGDRLMLRIRAYDDQPANVPDSGDADSTTTEPSTPPANLGESIAYTLRVVTPEELLAELGRREHEWRREFEQIARTQEQLNQRVAELIDGASAADTASRDARFAQEARTQRQIVGRVNTVLRQFEQIFGELVTNELATPPVRKRLSEGVIGPMRTLVAEDVPLAADLLDSLRGSLDSGTTQQAEAAQLRVLRRMHAILAEMIKWEGYNEAVALLRDVLRLQKDVNDDTRAELEREIEKLFESGNESRED